MDSIKQNSACGFGDLLVTCLYGEASEHEWRDFNNHCETCKDCRSEFAAFSSVRQELKSWEVEMVPRIEVIAQKSPFVALRELLATIPMWFKISTGMATLVAATLVLFAVTSARITVGSGGFDLSFGKTQPVQPTVAKGTVVTQDDVRAMVADAVAAAQTRDEEKANARMASLELRLNESHKVELQKAVMQLRDQRRLNSRLMMADNGHQTLAEWLFAPGENGDKSEGNENETRNY